MDMVEWRGGMIWARVISLFDFLYSRLWYTHSGETGDGGIAMFPGTNGGVEWPET